MSGLLPAGMRCSAWWYAQHRGLPVSLDYLKALGLTAVRMARWEGLEEWRVPERHPDGTVYLVCMWPERIWDAAAQNPAVLPEQVICQPPGPGYWEAGDY